MYILQVNADAKSRIICTHDRSPHLFEDNVIHTCIHICAQSILTNIPIKTLCPIYFQDYVISGRTQDVEPVHRQISNLIRSLSK